MNRKKRITKDIIFLISMLSLLTIVIFFPKWILLLLLLVIAPIILKNKAP